MRKIVRKRLPHVPQVRTQSFTVNATGNDGVTTTSLPVEITVCPQR